MYLMLPLRQSPQESHHPPPRQPRNVLEERDLGLLQPSGLDQS